MARSSATKVFPKLPQMVALLAGCFSAILRMAMMGAWHLRLAALVMILVVSLAELTCGQANQWGQIIRELKPSNLFLKDSQTRGEGISTEFLPASIAERIQVTQLELMRGDGLHTDYCVKFLLCQASGNSYAICGISTEKRYRDTQKV
jgi:hypothetical protein